MNLDNLLYHAGSKIHIKDPGKLRTILEQYVSDGHHFLQILTDFDRTLTKHSSNGQLNPSTHAVLEGSDLFSSDYRDRTTALRNKYYPLEMDPSIGQAQKEELMIEWWSAAHRLLLKEEIKKADIQSVVKESSVKFRNFYENFRSVICAHSIPMLVFSAGIGTIVREIFLQKSAYRLQNMEIISNFLHFNNAGVNDGFEGPLIHTFNKGRTSHLNKEYFSRTAKRKNVLLMGDTMGDLEMGNNLDADKYNIVKIGFLNDKNEQNRAFYIKSYDIVIEDPESMEYVFKLLCCIANVNAEDHMQEVDSKSSPCSAKTNGPVHARALTCPSPEAEISGIVSISPTGVTAQE